MNITELLLFLFSMSVYSFFISYQAFRFQRTYWVWPSVSGFKCRNTNLSSKSYSYVIGSVFLGVGSFFIIIILKSFF